MHFENWINLTNYMDQLNENGIQFAIHEVFHN